VLASSVSTQKFATEPSGFHSIVIPGALGESPYLLDGLLEHHTERQPEQIITDTAGYSDVNFRAVLVVGIPVQSAVGGPR
jgi:TnpA family transposase